MEEELNLAIEFLKRRAIPNNADHKKLVKNFVFVFPHLEVLSVLEMVKNGEFLDFYNEFKEKGHEDFI